MLHRDAIRQRREAVIELWQQGRSIPAIAAVLGVTTETERGPTATARISYPGGARRNSRSQSRRSGSDGNRPSIERRRVKRSSIAAQTRHDRSGPRAASAVEIKNPCTVGGRLEERRHRRSLRHAILYPSGCCPAGSQALGRQLQRDRDAQTAVVARPVAPRRQSSSLSASTLSCLRRTSCSPIMPSRSATLCLLRLRRWLWARRC